MCKVVNGIECVEVLPRSKSGAARGLTWVRACDAESPIDGVLAVDVERDGRREYTVTELTDVYDRGGRCFWVRRLGSANAYEVTISHRHESCDVCDCPHAHYHGAGCVHSAAMRAVLSNGWLDRTKVVADADLADTVEIDAAAVAAGLESDPFRG
jgi:hypothetical protein